MGCSRQLWTRHFPVTSHNHSPPLCPDSVALHSPLRDGIFLESRVWRPASIATTWGDGSSRGGIMPTATTTIIAIDILLEPDARMLQHAETSNTRLLQAFPNGFALDAAHRPHITMFQCFVPANDLDKVYAALGKVLDGAHVTAMNLEAFKYYYAPAPGGTGVAGIVARSTPELLKLQADMIAAAAQFTVETATIAALTAGHDNPAMDAAMIGYITEFIPEHSGAKFVPHVSTGFASREYLDKMLAESFEPFAFSPADVAVYQLGPYGTAAKKHKGFNLNSRATQDHLGGVLSSWSDGPAKQSIVDFVNSVTSVGGPDFVPVADRLAVFRSEQRSVGPGSRS